MSSDMSSDISSDVSSDMSSDTGSGQYSVRFGLGHGFGHGFGLGHGLGHGKFQNLGHGSDSDMTSDTRVRPSLKLMITGTEIDYLTIEMKTC